MKNAFVAALVLALVGSASLPAHAGDVADFERALRLAVQDKTKAAHGIIDRLIGAKTSEIPKDRLLMTKGRLLFQDGDMQGALKAWTQVPSESDWWLESLEERAWAHLRLGEHGRALAELKTLKAPMFSSLIGPEPFFLEGLVYLKICDYPAIFETLKQFKSSYRDRLLAIQDLSKTGQSEAASKVVARLRAQPVSWKAVAPEAAKLPRYVHRDSEFIRRVEAMRAGNGDAGQVHARLRDLAKKDLKEIESILQKMNLLEAEVIQRIHIAEKPKGRANRHVNRPKGEEVLVFEDTGEFWMDELDNYDVRVQGCPTSNVTAAAGGQKL